MKQTAWNNQDNKPFYEAVTPEGLKEFAIKGGLANGCDLEALKQYWSKAHSILEVGAGYGRVIDSLIKKGYQENITAVERCHVLFAHLKKQFHPNNKLKLLHASLYDLNSQDHQFDLILYMWSGIADFSKDEQALAIAKLAKLLKKDGILVIDTIPTNIMPLGVTKLGDQSYSLEFNNLIKYIYEPNTEEITDYAKKAGFSDVKRISCPTDTGRMRWLHILS